MTKNNENISLNARTRNECGRSMVEMLGVLAIIGLLSIIGLAGFKWGLDKHKVNEIVYNIGAAGISMSSGQRVRFVPTSGVTYTMKEIPSVGRNAYIQIDIEDSDVCKDLKEVYEDDPNWAVIGDCE